MEKPDLARFSDANYLNAYTTLAPIALDGAAEALEGLTLVRLGVPLALFNVAFIDRPLADAAGAIKRAIGYFDGYGLPFHVRIRADLDEGAEAAARANGLGLTHTQPGMCLHPIPGAPEVPSGLEVETVSSSEAFEIYNETMGAGFGLSDEVVRRLFPSERLADFPDAVWYLGRVGGRPVTTSALIMDPNGVAGVYSVATLEGFRRRGLGEAMTWYAIRDGMRAGATVAALQASDMGRPIYERMGFRTVAPYRVYQRTNET